MALQLSCEKQWLPWRIIGSDNFLSVIGGYEGLVLFRRALVPNAEETTNPIFKRSVTNPNGGMSQIK